MAKAWSPLVHTLEFGMTSTWEKGSAGEKNFFNGVLNYHNNWNTQEWGKWSQLSLV